MAEFNRRKKKVCAMCTGKTVDWKDVETLKKYTNEKSYEEKECFYAQLFDYDKRTA